MVTVNPLLEEIKNHRPIVKEDLIRKAFDISLAAHSGQKRKSGEPYFIHPFEVAMILAQHSMDEVTVATGLLHDVVEDTLISLDEISTNLGSEVAYLVDGVTKLSKVSFRSKDERQSESFRKMLLAMAQDIRVIIVKLADRLHNMRTLDHMPDSKRIEIAAETMDIYAPLAHRLGISWMKNELEDLSFEHLKPESYAKLKKMVLASRANHQAFIDRVIGLLSERMKKENIQASVSGRRKHYYSIYKKMESRDLDYEQVHDILAFRIIVETIPQCYEVLGHIHSIFKPIPGRFKDFIALPKANFYQSLHTTVVGPLGERIEIQIRTKQMHSIAEEGVAAHWAYKSGTDAKKEDENQKFSWLRQMVEWQQDLKDAHEFIESVKIDLFADEVYVFTPKGEVLDFPRGATPIDFAFRVHTQVGYQCRGARINGKLVPIKYELQNGDVVEIITDKESKPTKDWLRFAVTSKAKSKIRAYFKSKERDNIIEEGRVLLQKELKRLKVPFASIEDTEAFKSLLKANALTEADELYQRLGYGTLAAQTIAESITGKRNPDGSMQLEAKPAETLTQRMLPSSNSPILVEGLGNVLTRYAKCCNPLPGDKIVGFITRGRGITVHRAECPKILDLEIQRKVHVEWTDHQKATRTVKIKVFGSNKPGLLADISAQITTSGGNISHASIKTTPDQKAILAFDVEISNAAQLHKLILGIERLHGVISVQRQQSNV